MRPDLHEALDVDAHDTGFGHRRVFHQDVLDLDGRDPQPPDLDHVVGPALVPVEAVPVGPVAVAGGEVLADQRAPAAVAMVPVARKGTVALDRQLAELPGLDGPPVVAPAAVRAAG